jgi:hypothetical protein
MSWSTVWRSSAGAYARREGMIVVEQFDDQGIPVPPSATVPHS